MRKQNQQCPCKCSRDLDPIMAIIEARGLAELARHVVQDDADIDEEARYGLQVVMTEITERLDLVQITVEGLPQFRTSASQGGEAQPLQTVGGVSHA